jgi:hypothetical protein
MVAHALARDAHAMQHTVVTILGRDVDLIGADALKVRTSIPFISLRLLNQIKSFLVRAPVDAVEVLESILNRYPDLNAKLNRGASQG